MWWLVIPGAAAVAWKVYDTLREKESDAKEAPAAPPADGAKRVPRFWPKVRRWLEIARDPETDEGAAPPVDEPPVESSPRRRGLMRPRTVTLMTGLLAVVATVWKGQAPAVWLDWVQLVLMGAFIGIGTNWVAIKMLFHPRTKHLGLQGVIPANKERIAEQIARGVSRHLLDRETIRRAVHESDIVGSGLDELVAGLQRLVGDARFRDDVGELCVGYIGTFVKDEAFRQRFLAGLGSVARRAPERMGGVLAVFADEIGVWLEDRVYEHRETILKGLDDLVPELVAEVSDRVVSWLGTLPTRVEARRTVIEQVVTDSVAKRAASFDVEGLVRQRLEEFSVEDLEALILDATDEQLAWLQYLGLVIGALVAPLLRGLELLLQTL